MAQPNAVWLVFDCPVCGEQVTVCDDRVTHPCGACGAASYEEDVFLYNAALFTSSEDACSARADDTADGEPHALDGSEDCY